MVNPLGYDRPPSSPYKAYLEESQTPLACLVISLVLLVPYHIGVWVIKQVGEIPWANGADVLIASALKTLGIGGPLVSLCVVVVVFLFLQQFRNRPWRLPRVGTLALMCLESLIFALPPFLLAKLVSMILLAAGSGQALPFHVNLILSLGAGVYEEFLFRFALMGLLFVAFERLGNLKNARLYVAAVLTQAVLFALFHHLPGGGEELTWAALRSGEFVRAFAFRTLAGVYFAYLYQERGFGIAACSHAWFDVLAVMLNAFRQ